MRIFARSEEELIKLGIKKWLQRLNDYVHITGIRKVPDKTGYAIYRRRRQESSAEQKAHRYLTRHKEENMEYEQAVTMFSKKTYVCNIPYVQQKSLTNNNPFAIYIEKKSCEAEVYNGYGTYGLSQASTVPEF